MFTFICLLLLFYILNIFENYVAVKIWLVSLLMFLHANKHCFTSLTSERTQNFFCTRKICLPGTSAFQVFQVYFSRANTQHFIVSQKWSTLSLLTAARSDTIQNDVCTWKLAEQTAASLV